jgi:hypothetical protein
MTTVLEQICQMCGKPNDLIDPLEQLTRDIKSASVTLGQHEVRFLVDYYYQMQKNRIRSYLQASKQTEGKEPGLVLDWVMDNSKKLEGNIRKVLDYYTSGNIVGRWSKSIVGIGPVISAGLLAHIEIEKAPTVGHIWRYAGLDPTRPTRGVKGETRFWNGRLKTLCWKIGESFVKVSNNQNDVYGHIYRQRKDLEIAQNEAGNYADQAASKLETVNIGKGTEAYKYYSQGHLPPAHIHERAKRYAVKIFLSHWHHVAFETATGGKPPVAPYVISQLGHVDYMPPPNWPMA